MKKRTYDTLQAWMEATGTNRRELARLSRINESFLSKILSRSRRCSVLNAWRLSQATGGTVSVENLVKWFINDDGSRSERRVKKTPEKAA